MKKIYHLSSCKTCERIISELKPGRSVDLQDIKKEPIKKRELDQLFKLAGSYEALFSRKARNYRILGLHEKILSEDDYRKHLLEDYTFLKRPVIIANEEIFIGNNKESVAEAKVALKQ